MQDFGLRVTIRVVDLSEERCETKPFFRSHFTDMPLEYLYTRKIALCFIDVDASPVVFFGYVFL
jgi:hypothetical protein